MYERIIEKTVIEHQPDLNAVRLLVKDEISRLHNIVALLSKREKREYFDEVISTAAQWIEVIYDMYEFEYRLAERLIKEREQLDEFLKTDLGLNLISKTTTGVKCTDENEETKNPKN